MTACSRATSTRLATPARPAYLRTRQFEPHFCISSSSSSSSSSFILTHGTRRMAIANGTCVSFCNQPKAHFGLRGYAPRTIAGSVITWMERGFNAGQTHRSIYPSIFNRLRAIARYWSEIATFSYPLYLTPPLGCSLWNSWENFWSSEN